MSYRRLLDTFKEFGLTRSDAKIYIYLAKTGPRRVRDICTEMKIKKQQVYPCLENLQNKGIVSATPGHPAFFHAVPFEQVLDLFMKEKIGEAQEARGSKTELIETWQNIKTNTDNAFLLNERRARRGAMTRSTQLERRKENAEK